MESRDTLNQRNERLGKPWRCQIPTTGLDELVTTQINPLP